MSELAKVLPDDINFRDAIEAAKIIMSGMPPAKECELVHHFTPGLYAREMRIKKGTVIIGKIHKTEHLCTLNGDIEIASQDGKGRFTGFLTFVSKPGVQRIGYAHEDTVFTTFHVIDGTDVEQLEEDLVVSTFEEYERFLINQDYEAFLIEYGLDQEKLQKHLDVTACLDVNIEYFDIEIKPSVIHGLGMFTTIDTLSGEFIAPARINDKKLPAGRYINHSPAPNCEFKRSDNGDLHAHSLRVLEKGEELTINYRQAGQVNGWQS